VIKLSGFATAQAGGRDDEPDTDDERPVIFAKGGLRIRLVAKCELAEYVIGWSSARCFGS
jgi:hypothetical protein